VAKKESSVQLPKLVADLLETSLRFQEVAETLEVQLDKDTMRRLKTGEREYTQGKYKVASGREEIEKVLQTR
jgi:1,2-phenylacetyl-CoA epoxidase catalytic subunit